MKTFCIYFYQRNITFKNIINLVSFTINLVEYLVINSYSVTVLDNFRKETSDRAKKLFFWGIQQAHFHFGESPLPPWSAILDKGLMKVSLWQFELPILYFTTTLQVRELCSCFTAAWHSLLYFIQFYSHLPYFLIHTLNAIETNATSVVIIMAECNSHTNMWRINIPCDNSPVIEKAG